MFNKSRFIYFNIGKITSYIKVSSFFTNSKKLFRRNLISFYITSKFTRFNFTFGINIRTNFSLELIVLKFFAINTNIFSGSFRNNCGCIVARSLTRITHVKCYIVVTSFSWFKVYVNIYITVNWVCTIIRSRIADTNLGNLSSLLWIFGRIKAKEIIITLINYRLTLTKIFVREFNISREINSKGLSNFAISGFCNTKIEITIRSSDNIQYTLPTRRGKIIVGIYTL